MTPLLITALVFIFAFVTHRPFYYLVQKLLSQSLNRFVFFKTHISPRIQKPLYLLSVTGLWGMVLYLLPQVWDWSGELHPLILSRFIVSALSIGLKVSLGVSLIAMGYNLVDLLVELIIKRIGRKAGEGVKTHFIPFLTHFSKILVVLLGGLVLLQNMGINVSSMLAGLGLGGVAIALAAKDSASNILAYINIMLDRPFSVGDWVCFPDGIEGTVTEVGLRSCKVKTFYDSIVTVPNNTLATTNIDNMGKRQARRTRVFLGVQYDTSPERLESFIEGIKQVIKKNSATKKDYFQVYFTEFGPSELKIITNFFLIVKDWESELRERQNIFMEILKLARREKVQFAFPTQSLHVESMPPPPPPLKT